MATKSVPVTETPVATSLVDIAKQPDSITLFGFSHDVLNEMTIHARNGYRPFVGVNVEFFPHNGMMSILLQRGDPMPLAVQRAAETIANEQRKEAIEFERRVQEEAARRVTANAQAELDARIAAAEAVAEAQVARIREEVAAARQRIEAAAL
ncbi:hypothetical protein [Massilia arenae]|uniref:Uncharacterized protein n=1 Tax=Massilia arenae TaxID=2603288 RepID=A0A5C7G7B1_9BURK|nr:hypothetical protein [Massilia arenae]TXG01901.1 hypothetical protein FVD38_01600 [Massilia arenae]